MLYKEVELKDGNLVQFVGVHAVKWQREWGQPTVGFIKVDDPEILLAAVDLAILHLDPDEPQSADYMVRWLMQLNRIQETIERLKRGDDGE